MTPAEREESERRRKLIHEQNKAANPLRKSRVIPPKDRSEDLAALLGQSLAPDVPDVDWKSLTSGN